MFRTHRILFGSAFNCGWPFQDSTNPFVSGLLESGPHQIQSFVKFMPLKHFRVTSNNQEISPLRRCRSISYLLFYFILSHEMLPISGSLPAVLIFPRHFYYPSHIKSSTLVAISTIVGIRIGPLRHNDGWTWPSRQEIDALRQWYRIREIDCATLNMDGIRQHEKLTRTSTPSHILFPRIAARFSTP